MKDTVTIQPIDESVAYAIATQYGLFDEVYSMIQDGSTPTDALMEWDLYPF